MGDPLVRRLGRWFFVVSLVVVVAGSFYVAGYLSAMRVLPVSVAGVSLVAAASAAAAEPTPVDERFKVFWEAWRLIEGEFYDKSAIDYTRMTYGAIRGMLETLGDQHTVFVNPERARQSDDEMRGQFEGIGVTVEMRDELLMVVAPIEGSPAERAGLKAGDAIVEADGKDLTGVALNDAIKLIRGPAGTSVSLKIRRPGVAGLLSFTVTRDRIKSSNVSAKMLEGGVAYVKLTSFAAPAGRDVAAALERLGSEKPRAVVLDLRNNPGGLLHSAVDVTSQFLADGVVMYEKKREGDPIPFQARKGGLATDVPLAILVNGGSASASEIVAGALQDRGRAVLVGEPTFGKDSVQNVHRLTDSSSVRVTFARWLTPLSQEIGKKGLRPDIVVPLSEEDVRQARDPQLGAALRHLQSQLAAAPVN